MKGDPAMIEKIKFENFTAFKKLEVNFSPGINIFIGENGTGKTHILKAIYSACDITKSKKSFAEKITKVFLPSGEQTGRLAKRSAGSIQGYVEVQRHIEEADKSINIRLSLSNHTKSFEKATVSGAHKQWIEKPLESVYIPVKDMMANAPGFRSLYSLRNIHFEEVYADIIDRVFLGSLKGPTDSTRKKLLEILQRSMDGKVLSKNEEFFLKSKQGDIEFTLLAEGIRKLALLWVLIQNGTLINGSILFWDEPETNLNPRLMRTVVEILIELQRMGVQIFLTTHDYVILKEFDLQTDERDEIIFHSLYRDREGTEICVTSTANYLDISPNAIDDTFGDLVEREIQQSMGDKGQ
jgi:ABC-type lipoprotein export system ATPase subunit